MHVYLRNHSNFQRIFCKKFYAVSTLSHKVLQGSVPTSQGSVNLEGLGSKIWSHTNATYAITILIQILENV